MIQEVPKVGLGIAQGAHAPPEGKLISHYYTIAVLYMKTDINEVGWQE